MRDTPDVIMEKTLFNWDQLQSEGRYYIGIKM